MTYQFGYQGTNRSTPQRSDIMMRAVNAGWSRDRIVESGRSIIAGDRVLAKVGGENVQGHCRGGVDGSYWVEHIADGVWHLVHREGILSYDGIDRALKREGK